MVSKGTHAKTNTDIRRSLAVTLALYAAAATAPALHAAETKPVGKTVIVDIFRVQRGKVAEHWDVMQRVPSDAINKRPMY